MPAFGTAANHRVRRYTFRMSSALRSPPADDRSRLATARLHLSACAALLALCVSGTAVSSEDDRRFTAQQAESGRTLYMAHCAVCHGNALDGTEAAPALRGRLFEEKWRNQPVAELLQITRSTMPIAQPGMLSGAQYVDLVAFILSSNGYTAGEQPLVANWSTPEVRSVSSSALPPQVPEQRVDTTTSSSVAGSTQLPAVPPAPYTEWPYHRGDLGSLGYSSLGQINRHNVSQLRVAWRWRSDNFGPAPWPNLQATPLMADGVLYTTAGASRTVVAIDARTGETLWMHRFDEGPRAEVAPRRGPGRGVALWRGDGRGVIFAISQGYQLLALDAKTGRPVEQFGRSGVVDLKTQLDQPLDPEKTPIGSSSPPLVIGDVVIVGSAFGVGAVPPTKEMPVGHVAAFDVRTGERRWIFHTIPRKNEPGSETWGKDSASYTGNTGVWAPFSADIERGLVYLPVEAPTSDFYGGHRPGDNLYANSLVCLDARTGRRVWHYQIVHHDIWDYDLPAPPVLLDVNINGRVVPIVAQITKQGFTFVFNRVTGEPVWPIEERKVPRSDVPGEVTARTQPFPTLPEPFEPQGVSLDSLNDLTPEIAAEARRIVSAYRLGPLYTPPSLRTEKNRGTLMAPAAFGGANWQGAVADPQTGILYIPSSSTVGVAGLISDPERSNLRYVLSGERITGPFGLPLARPPWGRITAIDLKTGRRLWVVANADTPESVRNHEKLRGVQLPRTGHDERAGLLVTSTLLFAGEGSGLFTATGGGTKFRAHDKLTGEIIMEMDLGARQSGMPMTYAVDGRQYIVVPAGNPGAGGELIALTLP